MRAPVRVNNAQPQSTQTSERPATKHANERKDGEVDPGRLFPEKEIHQPSQEEDYEPNPV
jgi:hypothetical protein